MYLNATDQVRCERPVSEVDSGRLAMIHLAGRSLRVHYHDIGETASHKGVVVLLHGSGPGTTAWKSFRTNVEPIIGAGYRALLIDLPGWGKSDSVVCTGSRAELNARVVECLLDVVGIQQRVNVIGSSMGAHSTVALALAAPERVNRLILLAGGTGGSSGSEGALRMQAFYRSPSLQRLRELLEVTTARTVHLSEEFVRSRLEEITARRAHTDAFVASLDANPQQYPDVTHRLGEVQSPTLLVWGREDRVVPLDIGMRLLFGLKNAQLHVLGNCGHVPHQEYPGAFNRLALDFLEKAPVAG